MLHNILRKKKIEKGRHARFYVSESSLVNCTYLRKKIKENINFSDIVIIIITERVLLWWWCHHP